MSHSGYIMLSPSRRSCLQHSQEVNKLSGQLKTTERDKKLIEEKVHGLMYFFLCLNIS